ncbi:MAG: carbohydrate ABC transporter permease [Pseudomonadota bacterium]
MSTSRAMRTSFGLQLTTAVFLGLWLLIAAFPLFWVAVMSFKLPVDALAANPLQVMFGPETRLAIGGLSVLDIAVGALALYVGYVLVARGTGPLARRIMPAGSVALGWLLAALVSVAGVALALVVALPLVLSLVDAVFGAVPGLSLLVEPVLGVTTEHYESVWIDRGFWRNFVNSMIVTLGVVTISLTVGTLAGYGLARSGSNLAFWLLIAALIFRALPHSVLVAGYLPPFVNSREILAPIFGDAAPTLYGQPLAVIMVLVSINQPFTIWMLRSFFRNIPHDLDEAARVDGCGHFEAFRRVIMPVMWPGVITTGLFSFLLAYNDYLVCALLLDAQSQTMVPAITQYFNRDTTSTDQIEAIAAAVSIMAPIFLLVVVFQKQLVGGLTAGAVKG